jgi:YVTN family beta-propeller protein
MPIRKRFTAGLSDSKFIQLGFPRATIRLPRTPVAIVFWVTVFLLPIGHLRLGAAEIVARFPNGASKMVYDQTRDRVYIASGSTNSLVVIDAKTVTQIAAFYVGSNPTGLSITTDDSYLYVANSGSTLNGIIAVNLDTLTVDPTKSITTASAVTSIAYGNNAVIYALTGNSIDLYNAATAQRTGSIGSSYIYGGDIELTPDLKTLYYGQFGLSPSTFYQIDVSGSTPSVTASSQPGENGESLQISHGGQYVVYPNGYPYFIQLFSTAYFPNYYGTFNTGSYPAQAAFSWDDSMIFTLNDIADGYLRLYSTTTFVASPNLTLPAGELSSITGILTDPSNTLIFIGSSNEVLVVGNPMTPLTVALGPFSIDLAGHTFQGAFNSLRGRNYYLQYSIDLQNWTNLGASIRGNGAQQTINQSFPAGLPLVFFRLIKPNMN